MRTLAMPKTAEPLTSLREKLIKIRAKVTSHGRRVTFRMAEVAVPRQMFADILSPIARLRPPAAPAGGAQGLRVVSVEGRGMPHTSKSACFSVGCRQPPAAIALCSLRGRIAVAQGIQRRDPRPIPSGNRRMSVQYRFFQFLSARMRMVAHSIRYARYD
jgi:hypothetical protein